MIYFFLSLISNLILNFLKGISIEDPKVKIGMGLIVIFGFLVRLIITMGISVIAERELDKKQIKLT